MANKLDVLELDSKAIKAKLICQDCKRNPRPGMQVFTCMCQIYKCGACQKSSNILTFSNLPLFLVCFIFIKVRLLKTIFRDVLF